MGHYKTLKGWKRKITIALDLPCCFIYIKETVRVRGCNLIIGVIIYICEHGLCYKTNFVSSRRQKQRECCNLPIHFWAFSQNTKCPIYKVRHPGLILCPIGYLLYIGCSKPVASIYLYLHVIIYYLSFLLGDIYHIRFAMRCSILNLKSG